MGAVVGNPEANVKNQATAPSHCLSPNTRPSGAQQEEPPPRLPCVALLASWFRRWCSKAIRKNPFDGRDRRTGSTARFGRWVWQLGPTAEFVAQVHLGRSACPDHESRARWTGIPKPTFRNIHGGLHVLFSLAWLAVGCILLLDRSVSTREGRLGAPPRD